MDRATITRRCRHCGVESHVHPQTPRCPECGAHYGKITFGLDTDPAESARFGQTYEPDFPEVRRLIKRYDLDKPPKE